MKELVIYIPGAGGSAGESEHYKPLFPGCDVLGLAYTSPLPWEAAAELRAGVESMRGEYGSLALVTNSLGAYFSMLAGLEGLVSRAYFISPVVDMEALILGRMAGLGVTEAELEARGTIPTPFGEALSRDYLRYAREHPVRWSAPAEILWGAGDELTSRETITAFARRSGAGLTVMEDGEHWFHTPEQLRFLDGWILSAREPLVVNGEPYRLRSLLGRGKGGYSYLAEREGRPVVVKQIHHEPCDYYTFGDKLRSEERDYARLLEAGIPVPRLLDIDPDAERIVKEYVEGLTVAELISAGNSPEPYLPQIRDMAARARAAGLNIDYYPTNFVVNEGRLFYVDYECNEYSAAWDFEHWGVRYWTTAAEGSKFLKGVYTNEQCC